MLILLVIGAVLAAILLAFIAQEARRRKQALKAVDITDIDSMKGIAFENYIAILFESQGYKVTKTPASGDFGVDLLIVKAKVRTAVQIKRYKHNVDLKAVQQVVAGMPLKQYNASKSIVVTNSMFKPSARIVAAAHQCELVDRVKLGEWIIDFKNK